MTPRPRKASKKQTRPQRRSRTHRMSIKRAQDILIAYGFSPTSVKAYAKVASSRKLTHQRRSSKPRGKGGMLLSSLY